MLPMVTGLKYRESYSSPGVAGAEPLSAAAATTVLLALSSAAFKRLSGTALPCYSTESAYGWYLEIGICTLRRALTFCSGPFLR